VIADDQLRQLSKQWAQAVNEVRSTAVSAGRAPQSVRIIGVTKYVDSATTAALVAAGCADLGESRPQQLFDKATSLAKFSDVRWHLIGPLQRNKVRRTLHVAHAVHSIDNLKLLQHVDTVAGELGKQPGLLIEVNISGDQAKHGFLPDDILSHSDSLGNVSHAKVVGLMGMAGLQSDLDQAQREFASLRLLRDQLVARTGLPLPELSMGMSGDFVQAIAEGATMVRIGSRLFKGLLPETAED
jgi:PLP dependent protein